MQVGCAVTVFVVVDVLLRVDHEVVVLQDVTVRSAYAKADKDSKTPRVLANVDGILKACL